MGDRVAEVELNGDDEPAEQVGRPWGLIVATTLLLSIGVASIGWVAYDASSHTPDESFWGTLKPSQASVLVALTTVYAAALAATVGPLVYTSRVESMRSFSAAVAKDMRSNYAHMNEQIDLVRRSVKKMREASVGGRLLDEDEIRLEIEDIQQNAATLSETIVRQSRKWKKAQQFHGKWPGRRPWIALMYKHEMITETQREQFNDIYESRRFTRSGEPESPTQEDLVRLQATYKDLISSIKNT